jgi:hypothetical protein
MLIKKSEVKKLAQHFAQERANRGGRHFTRVGQSFYDAIESSVRAAVKHRVDSAPSLGKTLG